ncbi:MAG: hypothetical protein MJ107_05565 [Lachnospiraceae bacterium]|nr:hypothetical protein [Lachnospiraceae bacterium]
MAVIEGKDLSYALTETIMRKLNSCDEMLKTFFCKEEAYSLLNRIKEQQGTSGYIHRKKELVEKLNNAGIMCSLSDTDERLEACISKLSASKEMDRQIYNVLFDIYNKAKGPDVIIRDLVNELAEPEFLSGSIRLSILRQFIYNTNYHTAPVKEIARKNNPNLNKSGLLSKEEIVTNITEDVFSILDGKLTKDEKKKYALLRMCDDLAMGRFKTNGNTKVALYMFAFAFNMTVFIDPDQDIYCEKTDVEYNLFFNYYANNLLKYVSEDYAIHSKEFEAEPLGDGINYKNFAEVIYLYCLSLQNVSAREKLSIAEKIIEECVLSKDEYQKESLSIEYFSGGTRFTYAYKDIFMYRLRKLPLEDVVPFVCTHYFIDEKKTSKSRIMINSSTITAAFHYGRRKFERTFSAEDAETDVDYMAGIYGDEFIFLKVIKRMYEMLSGKINHLDDRTYRTDILNRYFQEAINNENLEGKTVFELFMNMRHICNPVLIDSRFQPISSNNLYDMFILITLYRYLNVV